METAELTSLSGEITHVFGHRFVLRTDAGSALADIGPAGAETAMLTVGDRVEITGEQKPSEIKVRRFTGPGGTVEIEPRKKQRREPDGVDEAGLVAAVEAAGFTVAGTPRRRPKHIEVLGRDRDGRLAELHVEPAGRIRKIKLVDSSATAPQGRVAAA